MTQYTAAKVLTDAHRSANALAREYAIRVSNFTRKLDEAVRLFDSDNRKEAAATFAEALDLEAELHDDTSITEELADALGILEEVDAADEANGERVEPARDLAAEMMAQSTVRLETATDDLRKANDAAAVAIVIVQKNRHCEGCYSVQPEGSPPHVLSGVLRAMAKQIDDESAGPPNLPAGTWRHH